MKKSDENNLIRVVRAIAIYNIMSVCAWPGTKKTKKKHLKGPVRLVITAR